MLALSDAGDDPVRRELAEARRGGTGAVLVVVTDREEWSQELSRDLARAQALVFRLGERFAAFERQQRPTVPVVGEVL